MTATLNDELSSLLGADRVRGRLFDRLALAHDASHYRLTPASVVVPRRTEEVAAVLSWCSTAGITATFRSGGTSLSGQASTDGVIVDTRQHFRRIDVLDGGARVRVEPGATIRSVNAHLAPYRRRLGPDPASEIACTVGGVIANNSSGMQCGTELNSFETLESLVVVLPSGTTIDTSAHDADERLRTAEPTLCRRLTQLRDRVRSNPDSVARIEHQYSMKNTMGYSLNAFTRFTSPVKILEHLMVGSEGTLGFVASATFSTVPVLPHAATSFLVFDSIADAIDALPALLEARARTLELLDAASLRVAQRQPDVDPVLGGLAVADHTALLVELQADDEAELAEQLAGTEPVLERLRLHHPATFVSDAAERARMWKLRKGLYTAVAGARPPGTTALLEDVAVPMPALAETTQHLSRLLAAYGHDDAVVFGHAKDGNLHFMINPAFGDPEQLRRYEAFTEDLVDLVLGHGGTLKAEHGTGRMMAPYVARQFGDELYDVMLQVKAATDPTGVLNPGVLVGVSPRAHLEHLKIVPMVDPKVDGCVECGYCETVCPSRETSTTPRQRIALLREIDRADPGEAELLRAAFAVDAVDSCAADSLCVTACPVHIDTGEVMKGFRAGRVGPLAARTGVGVARHFGAVVTVARGSLGAASAVPRWVAGGTSRTARRFGGDEWIPDLTLPLPSPGPLRRPIASARPDAVFFPACVNSIFGDGGAPGTTGSFMELCRATGIRLRTPEEIGGLCCGTPWKSKGFVAGHVEMAVRTFDSLWGASEQGRLPVVCDASSCSHALGELGRHVDAERRERFEALTVLDSVTFAREVIVPRLGSVRRVGSVAVHPTCSSVHMDNVEDVLAIARHCADEAVVPLSAGCCGFAGDRGLLHPELTEGATRAEAAEVTSRHFDAYVSSNKTCEIGMSRATGRRYEHVLDLLAACVRDGESEARPR
ncbi:FAD-binding and (Fe-S)-binding domain-containing protein [Streptomyces sp. NPDC047043]|uniref:FAD-binding and (Fe-S)-binding domain-containing protein n=1 Tax=Streptomyces sp. NPDC047043 TaxID=3154497 RepID=UPI0033D94D01